MFFFLFFQKAYMYEANCIVQLHRNKTRLLIRFYFIFYLLSALLGKGEFHCNFILVAGIINNGGHCHHDSHQQSSLREAPGRPHQQQLQNAGTLRTETRAVPPFAQAPLRFEHGDHLPKGPSQKRRAAAVSIRAREFSRCLVLG